ncbi:nuclear pre-mRNA splicing factor, component of splicing factor 3b [Reticulomyxa filosa]|uniref:Nuclear pre-mRNA splicing factor, component of splicing factor 3b n=1 Tax=Reticulomyxa filosa TaxID=46433 RepID=X6P695_RETFI|nr:nuclear pre-mRNA splicing factor, component of splicing factor 3b [Reticulomyxa filosa]|eukprot:ETO33137.1 nuclear pre-mRNA splicing factor, component of splicing factor 3b [Reticulomyxa filosa]
MFQTYTTAGDEMENWSAQSGDHSCFTTKKSMKKPLYVRGKDMQGSSHSQINSKDNLASNINTGSNASANANVGNSNNSGNSNSSNNNNIGNMSTSYQDMSGMCYKVLIACGIYILCYELNLENESKPLGDKLLWCYPCNFLVNEGYNDDNSNQSKTFINDLLFVFCEDNKTSIGISEPEMNSCHSYLYVSDPQQGLHVLLFDNETHTLSKDELIGRPKNWAINTIGKNNGITKCLLLDDETIATSDRWGHITVSRLLSNVSGEPSPSFVMAKDLKTDSRRRWGVMANDLSHHWSDLCRFNVQDTITCLNLAQWSSSLGGSPAIVYGTVLGNIGILMPLKYISEVEFLTALEYYLKGENYRKWKQFGIKVELVNRSRYRPATRCIDGDLCQSYFQYFVQDITHRNREDDPDHEDDQQEKKILKTKRYFKKFL